MNQNLRNIPLEITITGPAASGKTTLAALLTRLLEQEGHSVQIREFGSNARFDVNTSGRLIPRQIVIEQGCNTLEEAVAQRHMTCACPACGESMTATRDSHPLLGLRVAGWKCRRCGEEFSPCEGCEEPATGTDTEGVHLCKGCASECEYEDEGL